MQTNIINLYFDKAVTALAGNPLGRDVFNAQVKDKIDYEKVNEIVIPDQITRVGSSFVQGFFTDIVATIGYEQVYKKIILKSIHEELVKNMYEDLF